MKRDILGFLHVRRLRQSPAFTFLIAALLCGVFAGGLTGMYIPQANGSYVQELAKLVASNAAGRMPSVRTVCAGAAGTFGWIAAGGSSRAPFRDGRCGLHCSQLCAAFCCPLRRPRRLHSRGCGAYILRLFPSAFPPCFGCPPCCLSAQRHWKSGRSRAGISTHGNNMADCACCARCCCCCRWHGGFWRFRFCWGCFE